MKTQRKWLAFALALAAGIGFIAGGALADAQKDNAKETSGFIDRMKQWQNDMSQKFRETFEKLRKDSEAHGPFIGSASVDLREQDDSYTLRLNLPDRTLDRVEFSLKEETLHITAPAEGKLGRYQQSVVLTGIQQDANLDIERRQNESLIVVKLPKSSTAREARERTGDISAPLLPLLDWDRDVFSRMERMQREMDRVFEEGLKEFRLSPGHKGHFDKPRFGSTVDLKEEGGNYIIRAYLPGRDMQNVNVKVEDRILRIEAKAEETRKDEKDKAAVVTQKAQYSQLLTLPGPVVVEKMKVDRKEGMLIVTLPKAGSE